VGRLPRPNRYTVVAQSDIDGMLGMQEERGVRVVYLVNVNDTVESQVAFIRRLIEDEGLDIAMLELGNELYLNKFAAGVTGTTTPLGVTRVWTAEMYPDEMPAWLEALDQFGLPMYLIGCSYGSEDDARNQRRLAWNLPVETLIAEHTELIDGVTFHHYAGPARGPNPDEEETQPADFGYLSHFGDLPIAITESGYTVTASSSDNLEDTALYWTNFRAALKPTDSFGMHVLQASDIGRFDPYRLYDEVGRTPLGDRLHRWLIDGE
jgi:hypothetical protein